MRASGRIVSSVFPRLKLTATNTTFFGFCNIVRHRLSFLSRKQCRVESFYDRGALYILFLYWFGQEDIIKGAATAEGDIDLPGIKRAVPKIYADFLKGFPLAFVYCNRPGQH